MIDFYLFLRYFLLIITFNFGWISNCWGLRTDRILVLEDDLNKVPNIEFWPKHFYELELALVALIKHKIAESDLVARADEDVGSHVLAAAEIALERGLCHLSQRTSAFGMGLALNCIKNFVLGAVANANIECAVLVVLGLLLRH